jgi:hypothetical protein
MPATTTQKEDTNALLMAVLSMKEDMATVKATLPGMQADISEIKSGLDRRVCDMESNMNARLHEQDVRIRANEEYRLRTEGSLRLVTWAIGGGIMGLVALIGLIVTIVNNGLLP